LFVAIPNLRNKLTELVQEGLLILGYTELANIPVKIHGMRERISIIQVLKAESRDHANSVK
jgi:hypothetical protein